MKGTGELFAMKRLKKTDILGKEQVRLDFTFYFSICSTCFQIADFKVLGRLW